MGDQVDRRRAHEPAARPRARRVQEFLPATGPVQVGQRVGARARARVQEQQDGVGPRRAPPPEVDLVGRLAVEQHPYGAVLRVAPVLLGHLVAVGADPSHILLVARLGLAAEEVAPAQNGVRPDDRDELGGEVTERLAPLVDVPVDPADLVVLAVGVVVAELRAPVLVAAEQHADALGEHEGGEEVALHAVAHARDGHRLRRPLDAPVPAVVLLGTVVAVPAVGLVVALLVADEVGEGEAVMAGDEIDARVGAAPARGVDVARAGETRRQLGHLPGVAAPEPPHGVTERAVPLRPPRGEAAQLVAVGTDVPRFGDQLHLREDGVLLDDLEEGAGLARLVPAHEHRCEVEAEAVDVHVGHPVPQAVHDEGHGARVQDVEAVARPGEVQVVAGVVGHEPVVHGVVDAAQRQGGAHLVALAGVVVDDVQDDLEPGAVQGPDHGLELAHLLAEPAGGIAHVGRQEGDRVVAPVVGEAPLHQVAVGHKLVHRHELDGGHAEAEQVVDDRIGGEAQVGAPEMLGDTGVQHRHAAHVALVDDTAVERGEGPSVVAPGECRVDHQALRHPAGRVPVVVGEVFGRVANGVAEQLVAPPDPAAHCLRVGVDQQFGRIEAVPLLGLVGPAHPVAVERTRSHVGQIGVPDPVGGDGHLDLRTRLLVVGVFEQAQLDGRRVLREDGEVDPFAVPCRPEWVRPPGPDAHAQSSCLVE